jgi:hypothetical protein
MSSTVIDIIDKVFTALDGGTALPIIKYHLSDTQPTETGLAQYFIINMITDTPEIIDIATINVNCHAKDLDDYGTPDLTNLNSMVKAAKTALESYGSSGIIIYKDPQQTLLRNELRKEHFMNLRFIINAY